jgi:glycerophosphoryl diester phosphodiesterase
MASFDAALAAGVDMIEFDVLREEHGSGLFLAHDYEDIARRGAPTLEEGLAHLAGPEFAAVELDVDLKLPGYETRVVEALREHGLVERALISSQFRSSLAAVRELEPRIRLGWSVPKVKRDPFRSVFTKVPAWIALQVWLVALPTMAARAIRARECDAVMAHWRLITPRLIQSIRDAGGELYVWTVDELPRIRALEALGVTGVISNDPRLFAALA